MIKSIKHKGLRQFFQTKNSRKLPVKNTARVEAILALLDAAALPTDLNLPGMKWHPLGDMAPGRYSVWVSGNYRITFAWDGADAVDVDIEDYH